MPSPLTASGLPVRSFIGAAVLGILGLLPAAVAQGTPVTVCFDPEMPQAAFAFAEIRVALTKRGHDVGRAGLEGLEPAASGGRVVLATTSDAATVKAAKGAGVAVPGRLKPEGFSLRRSTAPAGTTIWVLGADAAGLMYGGLEVAEVIRIGDLAGVEETEQEPYMALRGTKFNCPLDVRTPSYSDVSDAAQQNIAEMWSFDFWREYIDRLARYRYNYVSLWSLHPFPSLVKVPAYPEVALDDVQRSKVEWKEYYSLNGKGFDAPEIVGNVEVLRKMTIDEKIAFWRKVMRHGKERNVDFYFVTWNIFVNGTGGKYGITDAIDNPTTRDYFRKSVAQMFLTYPDLAGVGLTTGENMHGASFEQKESWAFETYGRGVLDAAAERPGRKLRLIHRQHQTGARDIARKFAPVIEHPDIEFIFSFKYAKAHVYSSTTQPYHRGFVEDIGDLETIWTLRNDDVYHFRWGAPDFVREFMGNIPYEVSRGFYLGSDQYIWGREFLSREPESPRQIEIAKHWYHWMLWGRLGYDPELGNERFQDILQARFPEVPARELFTAWQEASMIYPTTTGFHWGSLDFQWYIEACKSSPRPAQTPSGFHDVERFITLPPHPTSGNVSIPDFVKAVMAGEKLNGRTPPEVARKLHGHADKALRILAGLSHGGDKELRRTLEDIRAMALLGKYYAHKIEGATELALFRAKKDTVAHQDAAVRELNHAASFWRRYASLALGLYRNPLWTNRVGICDWRDLMQHVAGDVQTAGGRPQLESMTPTGGGTLLEVMDGTYRVGGGRFEVEWGFDAPARGTYILELQYAQEGWERHPCQVTINGDSRGTIVCWYTGGSSTRAWDRLPVRLEKGRHTIRLAVDDAVTIEHLNVLPTGS